MLDSSLYADLLTLEIGNVNMSLITYGAVVSKLASFDTVSRIIEQSVSFWLTWWSMISKYVSSNSSFVMFTFRLIPLEKILNPFFSQIFPLLFFYKDDFGIKWPNKFNMPLYKKTKTIFSHCGKIKQLQLKQ